MEFFRKHRVQIWYYSALTIVIIAGLLFLIVAPCIGGGGPKCGNVNWFVLTPLIGAAVINFYFARQKVKQTSPPEAPQPRTWRADYRLPVSFIVFFVLAGILLGEHFPALPTYLSNINDPGNKPSVLDAGSLGDIGVVPVIYTVFGSILWLLFRFLNWRLVLVGGALIGTLAEWFLFTHKETGAIISANPFGATIFFITVWGVISLVPYFLYRKIDRKWGARGRWIAVSIVLILNILFTGFFAYQIYVRHNSHRGYPREQSSQSNQGSNNSNDQQSNSPVMIAEKSLATPFFKESDIASINEAFGTTSNSGWGFEHGGIDFMTSQDFVPFRAATDGIVESVQLYQLENTHNWQVGVTLNHGESALIYGFETFSSDKNVGEVQLKNIAVQKGQKLQQGDLIGRLYKAGNGAHVHFGVVQGGRDASGQKCPEPYFTDDAKETILRIIHKDHPDWRMCYK